MISDISTKDSCYVDGSGTFVIDRTQFNLHLNISSLQRDNIGVYADAIVQFDRDKHGKLLIHDS